MPDLDIKFEPVYDEQDKEVGVVIKYKDFQMLMEKLEDLHDVYVALKVKTKKYKTVSLAQVKAELFGKYEKK